MLFAQKERLKIMNKIRDTIVLADEKGYKINKMSLIAEICVSNGSTKRKAQEYINDLIQSGFCKDINGELELSERDRNLAINRDFESII